ncbi:hypothetical protein NP493_600g04003 [Ridgeia piscesae]|uniref:Fucolectin tachylectin-4 pentraxin-1 domain-containing protein n=1 Tax=Ridgeia piscesae TaxID=27915 RepID=A0AAD9NNZ6_RIDPI|nr:hypothetical protein NP493_600g04003 [Ridgeia piscesae]
MSWKKGATKSIQCRPGITGSVVRIRHTGSKRKHLSLCEVQVYGIHATMHDITVDMSLVENPSTTHCGLVRGVANPGEIKYVTCEAESEGRFVTVTSPGLKQMLSINEVQVYGEEVAPSDNIALNKKTQGMDGDNTSSLAVDGNTDPHGQCTRTTSVAWWRVVLGAAYSIISVTIFTPHCCTKWKDNVAYGRSTKHVVRLQHFVIEVFQPNPVHICAVMTRLIGAPNTTFKCEPGVTGRIVKIRMTGIKKRTLGLDEVRVFGMPVDFQNVAVNKSAVQSSTSNHKVAAAALDSGGICAETRNSDNPWWLVDLGGEYAIEQVVVTRRKGVRGDIVIEVAMARNDPHPQVCSTVDVMTRTSVACLVGTRATFVKITKPGKKRSLVLCQVEIYGHPVNVTNLAVGKMAVQSSTVAPASRATDGSTDSEAEQLHDIIIDVSISGDGAFSQRCAVVKGHLLLGETRHIPCVAGVKGRFVNITVPGPSETLSVCEVQVYGTTGEKTLVEYQDCAVSYVQNILKQNVL